MDLMFFCPRWGSENLDYETFFIKAKKAGYDGVEFSLPSDGSEKEQIRLYLKKHNLKYIAQHWETNTSHFEQHKNEYRQRLINLTDSDALFINAHTGKDFFSFEQNSVLIQIAKEISAKYGIKIVHETHRGRFSFAAHITTQFLRKIPDMNLALDLSHWCNVAESYLEDQEEAVQLAIERTAHVHARIGFPEGPQIPDPRAPEWKDALDIHTAWWKKVALYKKQKGEKIMTITPEFGPYPYMQILPHSKQPISNQWDINVYIMNHLKNELAEFTT